MSMPMPPWRVERARSLDTPKLVASLSATVIVVLLTTGCSSETPAPANTSSAAPAATAPAPAPVAQNAEQPLPPASSPYDGLPETARGVLDRSFTDDFDAMVKRRLIRAGVVFNRTHYFVDKGVQRGLAYESIKQFEDDVNARLGTGMLKVHVAFVPLARDQLFPALQEGKVDVVAATLTITPERRQVADFSIPTRTGVSEIVVTSANAAPVGTADDLAGREVFVRRSSSYYESLQALNTSLASRGRTPVTIVDAPEALEDDDVIEMVNAGLVDVTVVDDFMAEFWQQVFTNVRLHREAALRTNGEIAVGVRKNNPQLLAAVNQWIGRHGARTAFGNIMDRRYLQSASYVKRAASEAERKKFRAVITLFETYASRYDVDYLLMAAQGYQESGLEQSTRSPVGAIGIMQVMPATGRDLGVGDISQIEPNIHAGVKYFRFMMEEFFKNEPMDPMNKGLMTFASYNAGPGRIRQLRREAAERGLNPNVWFGNVERVVSERIGRETVQYVSNIYKYYVAYRLVEERDRARQRAKEAIKQ
jgi:membrane-bound lytic murein transglycosylase MltF